MRRLTRSPLFRGVALSSSPQNINALPPKSANLELKSSSTTFFRVSYIVLLMPFTSFVAKNLYKNPRPNIFKNLNKAILNRTQSGFLATMPAELKSARYSGFSRVATLPPKLCPKMILGLAPSSSKKDFMIFA